MTTVYSFIVYHGLCLPVKVECKISEGIGIHVIGMPDSKVRPMLQRVLTALQNNRHTIPGKKIVFNIKVEGTLRQMDLFDYGTLDAAIAAAFIQEIDEVVVGWKSLTDKEAVVGRLSQDGEMYSVLAGNSRDDDTAKAIDSAAIAEGLNVVYGWKVDFEKESYYQWIGLEHIEELFMLNR